MPRIKYQDINFGQAKLDKIEKANEIIADYQEQGFDLTLRQLYYQFVSRNLIENNEREYKNLGTTIADGRLAGLIDWDAIVDRTRFVRDLAHWESPQNIIDVCAEQYRLRKWENQPYYCEVFIEKDALVGVIEGVCEELDVPYLACRGYASASEVWQAAHKRIKPQIEAGKKIKVFYLGDHDPSGIDMSRDIQDRLDLFTMTAGKVDVDRLALNIEQIRRFKPPSNPTKLTDSRAANYVSNFGHTCWELDALDPAVISSLIRKAVNKIINPEKWGKVAAKEHNDRSDLEVVAGSWGEAVAYLRNG